MKLNKFSSSHRKCELNLCQKRDSQFRIGGALLLITRLQTCSCIRRIQRYVHLYSFCCKPNLTIIIETTTALACREVW
ncbi:hypothetical protein K439DRAFT_1633610 [Ramaria rubella]|nr:hypothetical protein K439DRAFT_1633610 [Ramaria rubella]